MKVLTVLILAVCSIFGLTSGSESYNFAKAQKVMVLPPALHEVSGITIADSLIACVQDENGIIFFYDPAKEAMVSTLVFGPDGDYEDIAKVDNKYFVLRSDGVLYEVSRMGDSSMTKVHYTGIPARNNEGLCYDRVNDRLLIAVKGKSRKGKVFKDQREIYEYNLHTGSLETTPLLVVDVNETRDFATAKGIKLPVKYKKNGKVQESVLKLTSSALAIHPDTRDLFLLSSADHLLLIFSREFLLKDIIQLDPLQCNKAEGMAFSPNSDLLISNEGKHKQPTILSYSSRVVAKD